MTTINHYAVFGGERFYAQGGWHDYRGSFPTAEQAEVAATTTLRVPVIFSDEMHPLEWWHIINLATGKMVRQSDRQAHGADT